MCFPHKHATLSTTRKPEGGDRQVEQLVKDIVTTSECPWNSPLFIVPKKRGRTENRNAEW